ncbi:DUF2512 family protein [Oscillospiraceae bacterium WX1]
MKHLVAILFKFVIVLVLLEILLNLMTALTVGQIFMISLAVTVVGYIIVDLLILSHSNNMVATLCNAVLSFLTIYSFNFWSRYPSFSIGAAIFSAIILAVGDWFFHRYLVRSIYPNRRKHHP